MEAEVKTRVNGKKVEKKTTNRKRYKLSDFVGCFKGQIFCDDAIFNLGIRPS